MLLALARSVVLAAPSVGLAKCDGSAAQLWQYQQQAFLVHQQSELVMEATGDQSDPASTATPLQLTQTPDLYHAQWLKDTPWAGALHAFRGSGSRCLSANVACPTSAAAVASATLVVIGCVKATNQTFSHIPDPISMKSGPLISQCVDPGPHIGANATTHLCVVLRGNDNGAAASSGSGSGSAFAMPSMVAKTKKFSRVADYNAVPSGDMMTTEASVDDCEKRCIANTGPDKYCLQYSWNEKSHHCFQSTSTILNGLPSNHVLSGCVVGVVKGCPTSPGPAPAPVGVRLPSWSAPMPDGKKPLGGYSKLKPTWTSQIHHGVPQPPHGTGNGTYNHNVMAAYVDGSGFAVSWKNCQVDEDCNGQRMLIALSKDGTPGSWSKIPLLLFPNMSAHGGPPGTMEPGPPIHINGRLYFAGSPGVNNRTHDSSAQGSQFCLWPDPLEPRNCGPPSNVAVQYVDTLLMREVKLGAEWGTLGDVFWASETGPPLFAAATAALGIKTLVEMDPQTAGDLKSLGGSTAPTPSCDPKRSGSTKCEACPGGCQLQNTINYHLGIANERTHWVAVNQTFDVIAYRSEDHQLWASTRNLSTTTGTAKQTDWLPIAVTNIPNDNSNLNAGQLPDGKIYLVHNPVSGGPNGRDPVTVATSKDGLDFSTVAVVLTCTDLPDPTSTCKPRWPGKSKNPAPSYPQAIAVTSPPSLAAFYVIASSNKEDIWITRFEYDQLP